MRPLSRLFGAFVDELTAGIEPLIASRRLPPRFALVERGDHVECYRIGAGDTGALTAVGSLAAGGSLKLPQEVLGEPVEVRLDSSRVISTVLRLPGASRAYLDAVIRHQLDRVTPWAPDRVAHDYTIVDGEPAADGQMEVRLVAAARDTIEGTLKRFAALGIRPVAVGTSDDPVDRPSPVNLLGAEASDRRTSLRSAVATVLLGVIVLGVGAVGVSEWRRAALAVDAAALQAETDAARASLALAQERLRGSGERGAVLGRKRDSLPMALFLERLSAAVPGDTHLTAMNVSGDELRIAGLSADAPALIGTLEEAAVLEAVRFASPTTREEGGGRDRFEIVARLVPAAVAGAMR